MKRKITALLTQWKKQPDHKPLLLYGARQVGKTYSALQFGKAKYDNTVYLNFEGNPELAAIFAGNLDPGRLTTALSAYMGQTILPKKTLLIFDEIQACERALTSLKYFCEQAPEYDIVAAGSLLGVALNRETYSFPVGKVDMITMYPLDFEEFLWALGQEAMANLIREAFASCQEFALHDKAMELYRLYLVMGGMPQAVKNYVDSRDFNFVLNAQKTLENAYVADMAKYASPQETTRMLAVWSSLPSQLAKENKKFQYKLIKSGARAYQYETALSWLSTAGLIHKCTCVSQGTMPLEAFADPNTFKVYLTDTGLLCAKFGIPAPMVLQAPHSFDTFKGALTENFVMQALVTAGLKPHYWTSSGTAEVDFVYQDGAGNVVPLEVKAATHVRSRSLKLFMEKYKSPYGLRVSGRNFGIEGNLYSIPLYSVFALSGETVPDDDVMALSRRFMKKNKAAYEVLAK